MVALIVHGGCHELPPGEGEKIQTQKGLDEYGEHGFAMLKEGKSALDTVEAVLSLLEDDPAYDAGTGSFASLNGDVEMDALIMDGDSRCGGVLCIRNVQHPISVARCRAICPDAGNSLLRSSRKGRADNSRCRG
jgi:beta-aspartyl-peptidase (threonine type)